MNKRRWHKQVSEMKTHCSDFIVCVRPIIVKSANWFACRLRMKGPKDKPYEGGSICI